jgi:hypothetical protein
MRGALQRPPSCFPTARLAFGAGAPCTSQKKQWHGRARTALPTKPLSQARRGRGVRRADRIIFRSPTLNNLRIRGQANCVTNSFKKMCDKLVRRPTCWVPHG